MKPKIKAVSTDCFAMRFSMNEVHIDGQHGVVMLSKYDLDGLDCDIHVSTREAVDAEYTQEQADRESGLVDYKGEKEL